MAMKDQEPLPYELVATGPLPGGVHCHLGDHLAIRTSQDGVDCDLSDLKGRRFGAGRDDSRSFAAAAATGSVKIPAPVAPDNHCGYPKGCIHSSDTVLSGDLELGGENACHIASTGANDRGTRQQRITSNGDGGGWVESSGKDVGGDVKEAEDRNPSQERATGHGEKRVAGSCKDVDDEAKEGENHEELNGAGGGAGSGMDLGGGATEGASDEGCNGADRGAAASSQQVIYVIPEQTPPAVRMVLGQRPGWTEWDARVHGADEWHFQWRSGRFKPSEYRDVREGQRLNHFPRSTLITRKDFLLRVLRKMKAVHGDVYAFHPDSYMLPTEYTRFIDAFTRLQQHRSCTNGGTAAAAAAAAKKKGVPESIAPPQLAPISDQWLTHPESCGNAGGVGDKGEKGGDAGDGGAMWIVKPSDSSRGRGVYLLRELEELAYDRPSIVQRYVPNPLTVGGYKADLRLYAVVTSLHPMTVHLYRDGIVRFATSKYKGSPHDDLFGHLTNSSINKRSPFASQEKDVIGGGCKWTLKKLQRWVEESTANGTEKWSRLWTKIRSLVCLSVLPLADVVPSGKGHASCFELFGFDIMVDNRLSRPHLIEINCSPALGLDEDTDRLVKLPLISDLLDLVDVESAGLAEEASRAAQSTRAQRLPGYCRPLGSSSSCSPPAQEQERRRHRRHGSDDFSKQQRRQQRQQQQQPQHQEHRHGQEGREEGRERYSQSKHPQRRRQQQQQQQQQRAQQQQQPQPRPYQRPDHNQRPNINNRRPELLRKHSSPAPMSVREVPPPTSSRTRPTSPSVSSPPSLLFPVKSTTADYDSVSGGGGDSGKQASDGGRGTTEPKRWLTGNKMGKGAADSKLWLAEDEGAGGAAGLKHWPTGDVEGASIRAMLRNNSQRGQWTGKETLMGDFASVGSRGCGFELVFPFNDDSRDHSRCLSKNINAGQARESKVQACVRSVVAAIKAHEKTCLIQLRSFSLRGGAKEGAINKGTTAASGTARNSANLTAVGSTRHREQRRHACISHDRVHAKEDVVFFPVSGHEGKEKGIPGDTLGEAGAGPRDNSSHDHVKTPVHEPVREPVREAVRELICEPGCKRICAGEENACFSISLQKRRDEKPPDDGMEGAGARLSSSAGHAAPMCGEDGVRRHSAGSFAATTGLGEPVVEKQSTARERLATGGVGGTGRVGRAGGAGRNSTGSSAAATDLGVLVEDKKVAARASLGRGRARGAAGAGGACGTGLHSTGSLAAAAGVGSLAVDKPPVVRVVSLGAGGVGGVGENGRRRRMGANGDIGNSSTPPKPCKPNSLPSFSFSSSSLRRGASEDDISKAVVHQRQQHHQKQQDRKLYDHGEEGVGIGENHQPPLLRPSLRLPARERRRTPACGIDDALSDEHNNMSPRHWSLLSSAAPRISKIVSDNFENPRGGDLAGEKAQEEAETKTQNMETRKIETRKIDAFWEEEERQLVVNGRPCSKEGITTTATQGGTGGGVNSRTPAADIVQPSKARQETRTDTRKIAEMWEEERRQLAVTKAPGRGRIGGRLVMDGSGSREQKMATQGQGGGGAVARPPAADIFLPPPRVPDGAPSAGEEKATEAVSGARKPNPFATITHRSSCIFPSTSSPN